MTRPPHSDHAVPASLGLAILTVSDTRTLETDASGPRVREILERAGHRIHDRGILPDDPEAVRDRILGWLAEPGCDGVITTGGTGISSRDSTYEAVCTLLDKRIDGFGELFRALSFEAIGSSAMLSRAVGGVARGKLLFALPGAPSAVTLALERLIVPELGHLAAELRKHPRRGV